MEYKKSKSSRLWLDYGLSDDDINRLYEVWREIKFDPEFLKASWSQFKENCGLSLDPNRVPSWKIENKEKWLWAKLKYGI
jgi:hypothetical protein